MDDLRTSLEALAGGFGGEIFVPGDAGFDEARAVWNAMIDRRPTFIARCRNTGDVIAAVRLAGARNLPIAIRRGTTRTIPVAIERAPNQDTTQGTVIFGQHGHGCMAGVAVTVSGGNRDNHRRDCELG